MALRLYGGRAAASEILVIDNSGDKALQDWARQWGACRVVVDTSVQGTSHPRNQVFRHAQSDFVCCLDSHVLLAAGAANRLLGHCEANSGCDDLLQGPMLYDDRKSVATHFKPGWSSGMYGTWATDPRGVSPDSEPFEIPMQGLGLFCCRREAWPGFSRHFRGFGGEEGYIHAKFKKRGNKTLCLPWLRWTHRFGRPPGQQYQNTMEDRVFNYLVGWLELGYDTASVKQHFASIGVAEKSIERIEKIALKALSHG